MLPYSLSVKVLILNTDGCCLLLKRSDESKNNPGKWDLPGGKLERGESFEQALLREVSEETGLEIKLTGLAGSILSQNPSFHIVNVVMVAETLKDFVRLSNEHKECMWVMPNEIKYLDMVCHLQTVALEYFDRN